MNERSSWLIPRGAVKPGSFLANERREPFRTQYTSVRKASFTIFGKKSADEKAIFVTSGGREADDLRQVVLESIDPPIKVGG